jgi:hypothetical protein
MKYITFVEYLVNFLRPYKDEPFFTTCVMKALEELGHPVNKSCRVHEPECKE